MRQLLRQFLQRESSSGIILLMMAILAMIWSNSPFALSYQKFVTHSIFWINEGLMTVFFLVIGLELKRGFLEGELSHFSQIILPLVAAIGGMLIPALIYLAINYFNPTSLKGWAIPVATDIAFALAVLTFFRKKVPVELKLFLLALAIFDDIGAMIIIAFFYSHELSIMWLLQGVGVFILLFFFNRLSVQALTPYILGACLLWLCLLNSGIHPTLTGVLLALILPSKDRNRRGLIHLLENALHPWVAFFIMPLFALANAGFSLKGVTQEIFTERLVMGIVCGLFFGKQIGVFSFSWLFIRLGFAGLPTKTSWLQVYGIALLCGIGFTMSLFLGTLSFPNESHYLTEVRFGVMSGSVLSGLVGAIILFVAFSGKK